MKKQLLFTFFAVFGVFLMIRTPLLAQSEEGPEKPEKPEKVETIIKTDGSRSTARVYVAPDVTLSTGRRYDRDFNYVWTTGTSSERNSRLTISKDYNGETTSKTGTFEVEKGVTRIRIKIEGYVKSGKINLEVYMPGKKILKKLSIDDTADIEWSESINIKEGENSMYIGQWTYTVNAENAKGYYSLSLNSY